MPRTELLDMPGQAERIDLLDPLGEMVAAVTNEAAIEARPGGVDPELHQLQRALAERERELAELRAELARKEEAADPLPDSGPGEYEIVLRHSPSKLKRLSVVAKNELDAWQQFCKAAIKKAYNPKDPHQSAIKALEQALREGAFTRNIRKKAVA